MSTPQIITAGVSVGLAGRFRAQKAKDLGRVDAATGLWLPDRQIITEPLEFPNIITNTGLDHIGNNGSWLTYCHAGTGTTAEAATDENLGSFVAGKQYDGDVSKSFASAQGTAPYYGRGVRRYEFAPGEATGNISELGISTQVTTGNLFSRALVKDGGGTPTTINVLANEYLYVDYEFRAYPAYDTADLDSVVSAQDFLLRAALVTTYDNMARGLAPLYIGPAGSSTAGTNYWGKVYSDDAALGAVTAEPTASSSESVNAAGNNSDSAYVNGTHYRDMTFIVPPSVGNFGASNGIKAIMFYTRFGSYQLLFDLEQAKTATDQATLVIRLAWARATIV